MRKALLISLLFFWLLDSAVYAQSVTLPEFYGIYAIDKGKLIELKKGKVFEFSPNVEFILFEKDQVRNQGFKLIREVYVRNEIVVEERKKEIKKYGKIGRQPLKLREKPVKGQPQMTQYAPEQPLGIGKYELAFISTFRGLSLQFYIGKVNENKENDCVDVYVNVKDIKDLIDKEFTPTYFDFKYLPCSELDKSNLDSSSTPHNDSQSKDSPQAETPSPKLSTETPEKITIAWLTKDIPDTGSFQIREETFNVNFDDAWDAATTYFKKEKITINNSDRERGVLITNEKSGQAIFPYKIKFVVLIEKVSDVSTKITVKGMGWNKFKDQWEVSIRNGISVSEDFLKVIRKELKSKIKQSSLSDSQPKNADSQKLKTFITDQWKQAIQIPPPKRDWRELVALKITGKYDDYTSLYLLGVVGFDKIRNN